MKVFLISFFFLFILSIYSCKKENLSEISYISDVDESYYPLTVGSYWIYKWVKIDRITGEIESFTNSLDTIKVLKDTLISNHVYSVIYDNNNLLFPNGSNDIYYRRESLGYILDQFNNIYFSRTNIQDILSESVILNLFKLTRKMEPYIINKETEAGIFDCKNLKERAEIFVSFGCETIDFENLFSKGVGRITESYFFGSQICKETLQRQLVEYHIEPE